MEGMPEKNCFAVDSTEEEVTTLVENARDIWQKGFNKMIILLGLFENEMNTVISLLSLEISSAPSWSE